MTQPHPSPRRLFDGQRRLIVIVAGLLLVIVAALVWNHARQAETAEDALLDYLTALADGDYELAEELAPAAGWQPEDGATDVGAAPHSPAWRSLEIDPAAMAAAARAEGSTPIADPAVTRYSRPWVEVGEHTDVLFSYRIGAVALSHRLDVERLPDTWWGARRWQVAEPFAEAVRVNSNLPAVVGVTLGGAPIDLSGPSNLDQAPQRHRLLHPGSYRLTAPSGTALTATRSSQDVLVTPAMRRQPVVTFQASDDLQERADTGAEPFLERCIDALPRAEAGCAEVLDHLAGRSDVSDARIDLTPRLRTIVTYQTDFVAGDQPSTPLRGTFTTGRITYRSDGEALGDSVLLYVWVDVTTVDDVTLTYRGTLQD